MTSPSKSSKREPNEAPTGDSAELASALRELTAAITARQAAVAAGAGGPPDPAAERAARTFAELQTVLRGQAAGGAKSTS